MPPTPSTSSPSAPGWYPDPRGRGKRYWDGHGWTSMTRRPDRNRSTGGGDWVRLSGSTSSTSGY